MQFQTFTHSLLLACILSSFALSAQNTEVITARLSGQQEALPVTTMAVGQLRIEVTQREDDSLRLVVTGTFDRLSSPVATNIGGGAHIHAGLPGQNGNVILALSPSLDADSLGGDFLAEANTFVVAEDFAGDADSGGLYVNIHTQNYPGGEIRGTLGFEDTDKYFTNLLGSYEVPSVLSRASGALFLELDDDVLYITGSFRDLSSDVATDIGGGAHLHVGLPGENGSVAIPLSIQLRDDNRSGIFLDDDEGYDLSEEQIDLLESGLFYVNLHTDSFRTGEIRGQVLPVADAIFRAHLAGANEWPVVTSSGSGQVLGHVMDGTLRLIGTFGDLKSPIATSVGGGVHLHTGMAGSNGGVIIPVDFEAGENDRMASVSPANNEYALNDAQLDMLFDRGIYFNVHTEMHTAGEIRGQMLGESQAVFTSFLTGNEQIPSVTTTGRGMVKVEMLGDRMTASGSFQGLMSPLNTSIAGGSHFHAGYPGQSGPVVYPLTAEQMDSDTSGRYLPMDNTFAISNGVADTLMKRFFYVNVHSEEFGGGEIRGSVLAEAESYFLAPLSGASEPQGVPTMATGMVAAEVTDTMVTLVGSFADLDSDFAADVNGGMHLHRALAGSNAGIVTGINTEIADDNRSGEVLADSNRLRLTQVQLAAMLDREIYVNVHTADYRSGAIRGQVLPLAGSYFHTTFSGANATNYVMTTAQGGLKLELIDTTLRVSGSVTMLDGDFDASVAGGAHLHLAPAGQNGGIVVFLNADPADDLKSARFTIDSNTFALADTVVTALRTGRLYANIHTTEVGSGEARGQIRGELNLPPAMSMILSPADGDSLSLEGASTLPFRVTYASTTDPDMDTVIYVWQLAADEDFETVLFGANTGRDTFFSTDFGTVAALLDGAGVISDTTLTLYHRVLASDGSNYTPSAAASVVITRGNIVSTRDLLPEGFAARAFPNPARGNSLVTYELKTQEAFRGRLLLFNQLGQLRQDVNLDAQVGTQNIPIDMSGLPAGQYFLTLRNAQGQLIHATRLLRQ